ncbi:hypothetical protein BDF14DRAFT_1879682 [Spinellus fusiger]|nr:hypothetical protein BDF14DRAFT_1879682 [Spinellus fusiger]
MSYITGTDSSTTANTQWQEFNQHRTNNTSYNNNNNNNNNNNMNQHRTHYGRPYQRNNMRGRGRGGMKGGDRTSRADPTNDINFNVAELSPEELEKHFAKYYSSSCVEDPWRELEYQP